MKVGFLGLGKLGLPCALALDDAGHQVFGYDISQETMKNIANKVLPYREEGSQELLDRNSMLLCYDSQDLVANCDIIFVPIQTPHDPRFEGTTILTDERADFDYSWLKAGITDLNTQMETLDRFPIVVIISTVLPGTIENEISRVLNPKFRLCYNPYFIAMGTTLYDFRNPEMILFGTEDEGAAEMLQELYATVHDAPFFRTTIKNAELIKVAYNTYIGMKIVYANTMMEICEKRDVDVDSVIDCLALATDRLISPKYLRGGMGDGGGCHPRDNIAMSWLAKEVDLSFDFFETLMVGRERQTEWLAEVLMTTSKESGLDPFMLGEAFKEETNLTVGSPALLMKNIIKLEYGIDVPIHDPHTQQTHPHEVECPAEPHVFFISTKHQEFTEYKYPEGSIIIDPWRYMPDMEGVTVHRLGESKPNLPVVL
ncbi:MAG: nucleotide sugar dehydrogenase [Bacteroidetes bacterium]|nr:nucleotide sugar dehydrogenase [Bacteroidota bacterium]